MRISLLAALLCLAIVLPAQNLTRPRIGLTLSGGGAKGLAHIGILKAIDSAGLQVNYVTGTSMGSIIGALYAIGYSADSIEKIARSIDWDLLLSNQSSLRTLFMEEKEEYNKYFIELPWLKNRFRLPTGLLEGQELWLKLAEFYFPVYNRKKFNEFSIPFKCIGTDVGSGEAVVLDSGELAKAIRASMAIPSLFTAVDIQGKKLVDGGIVRNFPVRDVKEMGADFVIGSNVASGLLPSEKVRNVIQVLLQVAFFREAQDNKQEVPLCDIYIPIHLEQYTMGSFAQVSDILDSGIVAGQRLYPRLIQIKDSFDARYGPLPPAENRLPSAKRVRISSCEVNGLEKTSYDFFIHTTGFEQNQEYTVEKISAMVRAGFGTRYYSRITYSLQPQTDGSCKIIFDVTENPLTFAKLGLHYNTFSNVALILNLTSRNFFIRNSRSSITLNLSENFRVRGEHLQYLGRRKNFSMILAAQYDHFDMTSFTNFRQDGLYKQYFFKGDFKTQFSTLRNFSVGIGQRFEYIQFNPAIFSKQQFSGNNSFVSSYAYLLHNNLDKTVYPHRGIKIELEGARIYAQSPDIEVMLDGNPLPPDSPRIGNSPYSRLLFNFESYSPISRRGTLLFSIQSGINVNYKAQIMNEFVVGGLVKTFRNQVLFAGLPEGTLYSPAMAVLQGGFRYEMFNNTFIVGKANVLFNNFVSKSEFFNNPDMMTGYALGFGYNFALGPLEFSLMYSGRYGKVISYVNIGIPF